MIPNLNDALKSMNMPSSTRVKSGTHKIDSLKKGPSQMSGSKKIRQPTMGVGVRSVEIDDIPSDISADEWGEIQKFGQKLHEEQIKKAKQQHLDRVNQVRNVLDQQVKLRSELREKQAQERREFDKKILDAAKKELEIEQQQKREL